MERKRLNGRFVKETEEGAEPAIEKPAAVGAPRPRHCRTFAKKRVAEAMPELIDVLISKAKAGSVPHVKALVEISGLTQRDPAEGKKPKRRGKSYMGALLEELGEA